MNTKPLVCFHRRGATKPTEPVRLSIGGKLPITGKLGAIRHRRSLERTSVFSLPLVAAVERDEIDHQRLEDFLRSSPLKFDHHRVIFMRDAEHAT